ncbi:MAG: hypothetical protein M0Q01_11465 [Syntrophales bacterium]|jgi:hypothetical protein|nr:hypothetical protein [Syntrophales bacterium]
MNIIALMLAVVGVIIPVVLKKKIHNVADRVQIGLMLLMVASLILVYGQLRENNKANVAATRGQLYQKEDSLSRVESEDKEQTSSIIYLQAPVKYQGKALRDAFLGLLDADDKVTNAESASALEKALFDLDQFKDPKVRKKNKKAVELFLHTGETFYHVHNSFDYMQDGILSKKEWDTWKGQIREIGANPMLLAVIYQGWKYQYFSRKYGKFIQDELCAKIPPPDVFDREKYERDRNFIISFYPEMMEEKWLLWLPDY